MPVSYPELGVSQSELQAYVQRGQLAGLSIANIIQIIFQFGIPVLEEILSLLGSNPTLTVIEAILAVLGGLVIAPTPAPNAKG